jgi:hypothetical protein
MTMPWSQHLEVYRISGDRLIADYPSESRKGDILAAVRERPRGRGVNSAPMRRAFLFCQPSLPDGTPSRQSGTATTNVQKAIKQAKKEECPLFAMPGTMKSMENYPVLLCGKKVASSRPELCALLPGLIG